MGSVFQTTMMAEFEDGLRIQTQTEAETAARGFALYLKTRALLFWGAWWTRFLREQEKVHPTKFCEISGINISSFLVGNSSLKVLILKQLF